MLERCCLTCRSTGHATARHTRRAAGTRYIVCGPGLASFRRRPVSFTLGPTKPLIPLTREFAQMLRATCHCGTIAISIPHAPEKVTNCNCSICRRYGTLWGYFDQPDVLIEAPEGKTQEYARGDKSIAFVRCSECGCVTHWRPLPGRRKSQRMGVNIRIFQPEAIGPVRIRLLDGAVTEEYVGEYGPV